MGLALRERTVKPMVLHLTLILCSILGEPLCRHITEPTYPVIILFSKQSMLCYRKYVHEK